MLASKNQMLKAGIPINKHYLFKQSAQLEAFKVSSSQNGLSQTISQIDSILLFKSYIQVRALKHGAPLKKALLFSNILQLRAFEAGASIEKALKTVSLKYVQALEKKQILVEKDSQQAENHNKDNQSISESSNNHIKYHLVLDIDDVLCREISKGHSNYQINQTWINDVFPGVEILKWQKTTHEEITYFCYPGFEKLALAVFSWDNWSLDFFSAEVSARNEKIIHDYFINKLGYKTYSKFSASGKLNIFSNQDLTAQETSIPRVYKKVKDLRVITDDVDNAILVDDNVSNAANGQEQMIGLSIEASKEIVSMVKNQEDKTDEMLYNPLNNAAYAMGIILLAKELLENNEASCLREAIDLTLSYKGSDDSKCNSLWYLYPSCALEHDPEYQNKMEQWVTKGQNYLDQFIGASYFD